MSESDYEDAFNEYEIFLDDEDEMWKDEGNLTLPVTDQFPWWNVYDD